MAGNVVVVVLEVVLVDVVVLVELELVVVVRSIVVVGRSVVDGSAADPSPPLHAVTRRTAARTATQVCGEGRRSWTRTCGSFAPEPSGVSSPPNG